MKLTALKVIKFNYKLLKSILSEPNCLFPISEEQAFQSGILKSSLESQVGMPLSASQ